MYNYKVTRFNADILDKDKDWPEKIRAQLEHQLEEHANDGWELQGQYNMEFNVNQTGCFGKSTGKITEQRSVRYLVFKKEI